MNDEQLDELGKIADSIDNIICALEMPLPDKLHLAMVKTKLKEWSKDIKSLYTAISGDNPWEEL